MNISEAATTDARSLGPPLLGIGVAGRRVTLHGRPRDRQLTFVEEGVAGFALSGLSDEWRIGDVRAVGGVIPADAVIAEATDVSGRTWIPVRMARGVWLAAAPVDTGVRILFRGERGVPVAQLEFSAAFEVKPPKTRPTVRSRARARRQVVRNLRPRG